MAVRRSIFLALLTVGAPAQASEPVTGRWVTQEGDSIVDIAKCGSQVCGRVERLLRPVIGGPATDRNNRDPALRSRPLVGLPILAGFTDRGREWVGTIYDPRSGKTYRSKLSKNADGSLKVQGCIAVFCQTQRWTSAR
ncbi:DUF2147 domain-containing protein [Nostoc sp. HG1]|nr:DUF2147 domain-containing protein [Nostoc sp. HG1]